MKYKILLITLLMFGYITNAGAITEFTFEEQGYDDFYINGVDSFDCTKFNFFYNEDYNSALFPFLSINAEFFPTEGKNTQIIVYFNDDNSEADLTASDFSNNFARIALSREKLKKNNEIRICGKTSFSVNKIKISSKSYFGVYFAPLFKENSFILELDSYHPTKDIPFSINAVAKNYGSKETKVNIEYRRPELEEKTPEISILTGETQKEGVIPPCQKRDLDLDCVIPGEYQISYLAVANISGPMSLLPAILSYEDVFGETRQVESNRPNIGVLEPEDELSAQIFLDKDNPFTGEEIKTKIRVLNKGKTRINNIDVSLLTGLEVIGEENKEIDFIETGQTKEVAFTAKGLTTGEYSLSCNVQYNGKEIDCSKTKISITTESLSNEILLGIGFVIIALATFLYYYLKK